MPFHLKFKLGAAEVGPLFLPEVVWLDDEGNVDTRREGLLKDLQQRLDAVPFRTTHVHDDREAMSGHFLAEKKTKHGQNLEEQIIAWEDTLVYCDM